MRSCSINPYAYNRYAFKDTITYTIFQLRSCASWTVNTQMANNGRSGWRKWYGLIRYTAQRGSSQRLLGLDTASLNSWPRCYEPEPANRSKLPKELAKNHLILSIRTDEIKSSPCLFSSSKAEMEKINLVSVFQAKIIVGFNQSRA